MKKLKVNQMKKNHHKKLNYLLIVIKMTIPNLNSTNETVRQVKKRIINRMRKKKKLLLTII